MKCQQCMKNMTIETIQQHMFDCHEQQHQLYYDLNSESGSKLVSLLKREKKSFCPYCQCYIKNLSVHQKSKKHSKNTACFNKLIEETEMLSATGGSELTTKWISKCNIFKSEVIDRKMLNKLNFCDRTSISMVHHKYYFNYKTQTFQTIKFYLTKQKDTVYLIQIDTMKTIMSYIKSKEKVTNRTIDVSLVRKMLSFYQPSADYLSPEYKKKLLVYNSPYGQSCKALTIDVPNIVNTLMRRFKTTNIEMKKIMRPKYVDFHEAYHWNQFIEFESSYHRYQLLNKESKLTKLIVYHGYYTERNLGSILEHGYIDPMLSNSANYGKGAYFTTDPGYCCYLGYSNVIDKNKMQFLVCEIWYDENRFMVGEKDKLKHYDDKHHRIDTFVNCKENPYIYCIQNTSKQRILGNVIIEF